jgi:hypothetical protein
MYGDSYFHHENPHNSQNDPFRDFRGIQVENFSAFIRFSPLLFSFFKLKIQKMAYQQKFEYRSSGSPLGFLWGLVLMALFFVGLFFLAKGIFNILAFVAPFLLVITLLIDYRVVTGYAKWVLGLFRTNLIGAIAMTALTIFGFPVVIGYLFFKSLVTRKVRNLQEDYERRRDGELVDFEEIESRRNVQPPPVELPKILPKEKAPRNPYDQMFEE